MKNIITMYKGFNHNSLTGGWFWRTEEYHDAWEGIDTEPYKVEVPEGFSVCKDNAGQKMLIRDGEQYGCEVCASNSYSDKCVPLLIDSHGIVRMRVIEKVV